MPMIHELKAHPQYFKSLWDESKKFEVRRKDRDFKVGDRLLLKEWEPQREDFTGVMLFKRITYILDDPDYCKEGFVILAIE